MSDRNQEKLAKSALEDCQCVICLDILIEPVTMPCGHELCLICFEKHLQETSLTCPMCRQRVSNWARNARRSNTLVNQKRWAEIKKSFPKEIRKSLRQNSTA